MHSLDVWESEEDSVRFYNERMIPALAQMGLQGGPPLSYQEFDLPEVTSVSTAPAA